MKKKIKLIYIINSLEIGGAEKNLLFLSNYLTNKKKKLFNYELHIISLGKILPYYKKSFVNVKFYELNYKTNFLKTFINLYKLVKHIDPDLIHTWLYASDLVGSLISILLKKKIIWSVRSSDTTRHLSVISKLSLKMLSYFSNIIPNRIIANSFKGRDDHIKIGYEETKLEVIPNAYFLKKKIYTQNPNLIFDRNKNNILIGTVGRDHPMKDHFTFVESAYYLKKKIKNVKFLILGKNVTKNILLKRQIEIRDLKKDLILLEPRSININKFYKKLDIFCLTSCDSEGFPNVLVESVINHTLAVTTRVGDSTKIINQKELIIPIKNPKIIAEKCLEIINFDSKKKIKLLNNLIKNVQKFNIDVIAKKYENLYEDVIFGGNGDERGQIGLVPLSKDLTSPGDRRRFAFFLKKRKLPFKILDNKTSKYKIVFLTQGADITTWVNEEYSYIIYDLTDSYLNISRKDFKGWIRGFAKFIIGQHKYLYFNYWNLLKKMCKRADMVICSTIEQKKLIQKYNKNVHIILDTKDLVINQSKKIKYKNSKKAFNIVWEGLPQNVYQLKIISNSIIELSKKYNIKFNIVTDLRYKKYLNKFYNVNTYKQVNSIFKNNKIYKLYNWKLRKYYKIILSSDLAIIPTDLNDNLTAGKPENKLLLFWRMGLPVITSSSPAYKRTMLSVGLNNFCKTEKEWTDQIENMIVSYKARNKNATIGKNYSEKNFSNEKILKMWNKIYRLSLDSVNQIN
jgi:glycosyltransferase involved in cell wall biosynthesis